MKLKQLLPITLCLLLFGMEAHAQLNGVLLTKEDSTPIARAHIINLSAQRGTISDVQGKFTLQTQPTDSISISVIGYQTLVMQAQQLPEEIYLVERNYQLELFNVMPYKTFAEFKEAFVNLELPDTTRHINPTIYLSREELAGMGHTGTGIIVPGVISGIFASFNKLMKDKVTYQELLKRDEYEAFLATKFNAELVQKITRLTDNTEINDFIKYCDFSNQYIANNSNYTIITQVFECYDEYISLSDL